MNIKFIYDFDETTLINLMHVKTFRIYTLDGEHTVYASIAGDNDIRMSEHFKDKKKALNALFELKKKLGA